MSIIFATFQGFQKRNPTSFERLQSNGFSFYEKPSSESVLDQQFAETLGKTHVLLGGTEPFDARVFDRAPELKLIVKLGTGVDNIALDEAQKRGITVCNTAGVNANAVAELAVALMLSLLRTIPHFDRVVKDGAWVRPIGREIRGKKVGLVGFGRIPQLIAKKLAGFEVELLAFDIIPQEDAAGKLGVSMVSFEKLLALSDIVSVHVPGIPQTNGLFTSDAFAAMQCGALFLNLSRGSVVDTSALLQALDSGHLAGAAIDVYETEPPGNAAELKHYQNLICTPHVGGMTMENMKDECEMTVDNILGFFAKGKLVNRVI